MKPFVHLWHGYASYFGMYVFLHGWEAPATSSERQRGFCGIVE